MLHATSFASTAIISIALLALTFQRNFFRCTQALNLPSVAPEVSPSRLERVSRLVSAALGDDDEDTVDRRAWDEAALKRGVGNDAVAGGGGGPPSSKDRRYASARSMAREHGGIIIESSDGARTTTSEGDDGHGDDDGSSGSSSSSSPSRPPPPPPPMHELVYGELSVPVLATLLDAVGVRYGEKFLDIGSGDGALVLGASLLYAVTDGSGSEVNAISKATGIEIVPGLLERSKVHDERLEEMTNREEGSEETSDDDALLLRGRADTEFLLGDVLSEQFDDILADTTLAVCFATTWSAGNADTGAESASASSASRRPRRRTSLMGRALPKLSSSLKRLPVGARVVIVDGKLDVKDSFTWHGDLKIQCPDTAPYSVASLYERKG